MGKKSATPWIDSKAYRTIVETSPDATLVVDSEGILVLVNRQAEVLFGYHREELIGEPIEVLVPERYRGHHHIHRDGYFGHPKTREMGADVELCGLCRDGSEFPVEISLAPLRTDDGIFAIASVRDATQRKRNRDQINSLLETAPDAMIIIDAEGRISRVNRQTERLFGYVREALIGKPVEILVPERLRDRHVAHRSGYLDDPKVRGMGAGLQLSGRRKNGTEFPIEISLSPLTTAEGTFATAAVRDISDRVSAERRFRELLDSAPDAMVIINQQGVIELVNRQAETLFGHLRAELVGKPIELLIPPVSRAGHVGHLQRYFRDPQVREMGAGLELAGFRKDGTTFPVEISLSPLHGDGYRWATAAIRDVTDRKDIEGKLQEYTAKLEASNEELEQFAYVASHDLQAPLNRIISLTNLLRRAVEPHSDPNVARFLEYIEAGGRRMSEMVRDILSISRLERGGIAFAPVDLTAIAHRIVSDALVGAEDEQGQVHVASLPTVTGDAGQLGQVLQNLISNGLKFHAPNVSPQVWVSASEGPAFWTVQVEDNGIGVPAKSRDQVFDIFTRLHSETEYSGTGIGLAICRRIIRRHGGEIVVVESEHGGSCFRFTLSRAHPAEPLAD